MLLRLKNALICYENEYIKDIGIKHRNLGKLAIAQLDKFRDGNSQER
jgi:hypothetical protein